MKRFSLAILLAFVLSACQSGPTSQQQAENPAPSATVSLAVKHTATLAPTSASTGDRPVASTATTNPTPTPTPTISLPVGNTTPLPELNYQVITWENLPQLREVARYGEAQPLGISYVINNGLAIGMADGIQFLNEQGQLMDFLPLMPLRDFAITPDGLYVLAEVGGDIEVYSHTEQSWKKTRTFPGLGEEYFFDINHPAISTDGQLIAIPYLSEDWWISTRVYRVSDGAELAVLNDVYYPQFLPNGNLAGIINESDATAFFSADTWQRIYTIPAGIYQSYRLTISPDGSMAVHAFEDKVLIYQLDEKPRLVRQLTGWQAVEMQYPEVTFLNNDRVLLVTRNPAHGGSAQAALVDIPSGEWTVRQEIGFSDTAWSDGQQIFTMSGRERWTCASDVRYDLQAVVNQPRNHLLEHLPCIFGPPNSENTNTILILDENLKQYLLYDLTTSQKVGARELVPMDPSQPRLSFTAENISDARMYRDHFVVNADNRILIYHLTTGERVYAVDGLLLSTSFSGDWIAITRMNSLDFSDQSVILFNIVEGKAKTRKIQGTAAVVSSAAGLFAVDTYGATPRSSIVQLFSLEDPKARKPSREIQLDACLQVMSLAFFPDGSLLLAGCRGGKVIALPVENEATAPWVLWSGGNDVLKIAFSADGRLLAIYTKDGFARVWAVIR